MGNIFSQNHQPQPRSYTTSKVWILTCYHTKISSFKEPLGARRQFENILENGENACIFFFSHKLSFSFKEIAEPHSSVGRDADLRTGGSWFDPQLGQFPFGGLMIVIATGFIPLSPLSIVSTMVLWESSQWLEMNIVRSIQVKRIAGKHG